MFRVTLSAIEWDRGKEPEYQRVKLPSVLTYEVRADSSDDAIEQAQDLATDETGFCLYGCKAVWHRL